MTLTELVQALLMFRNSHPEHSGLPVRVQDDNGAPAGGLLVTAFAEASGPWLITEPLPKEYAWLSLKGDA